MYLSFRADGNATQNGIYVVKYNTSGTYQWQQTISGGTYTSLNPTNSVTDSSGNVYIGAGTYVGANIFASMLFKYNSSGTLQWQRAITSTTSMAFVSIAVDNTDSAVVLAMSNGTSTSSTVTLKYPMDGSKTGTYSVGGISVVIATGNASSGSPGYGTSATGAMSTGATSTSTTTNTITVSTPTQSSAVTDL